MRRFATVPRPVRLCCLVPASLGCAASIGGGAKADLCAGDTLARAAFPGTFSDSGITSVTGQSFVMGKAGLPPTRPARGM